MTCVFPNVIESLTGSDANYELVTSSTISPLKLFWSGATKLIIVIFYQSKLQGLYDWTGTENGERKGERFSAQIIANKVKEAFVEMGESLSIEV